MTTSLDPQWALLVDTLTTPVSPDGATVFDLRLSDVGYTQPDGTWKPMVHQLTVGLHPYGIARSGTVGYAYCACQFWNDWNWRTATTPHILPYGELATWIAGHAKEAGADDTILDALHGIPVLRALADLGD